MEEPLWLTRAIIETLHSEQIREHGGRPGLRDASLLESPLARARQLWSFDDSADLVSLAAEYGFGLAKNHACLDGNKRIALVATNVFLILNEFEIDVEEPVVVDIMLRVADGRMDRDQSAEWIRSAIHPYEG